jgi:hypothetical protein
MSSFMLFGFPSGGEAVFSLSVPALAAVLDALSADPFEHPVISSATANNKIPTTERVFLLNSLIPPINNFS